MLLCNIKVKGFASLFYFTISFGVLKFATNCCDI